MAGVVWQSAVFVILIEDIEDMKILKIKLFLPLSLHLVRKWIICILTTNTPIPGICSDRLGTTGLAYTYTKKLLKQC
jgi:hypothetical protein